MATELDNVKVQPTVDHKLVQQQQVSSSTGVFVANTTTKAVAADIDDPHAAIAVGVSKLVDTRGKSFIDFYHLYAGTNPSTDITIVAFGFFLSAQNPINQAAHAVDPSQVDGTNFAAVGSAGMGGGYWLPLFKPEVDGPHEQTLHPASDAPQVTNSGSSPVYKIRGKATYGCEGAVLVIVLVTGAASEMDAGLIIAKAGN